MQANSSSKTHAACKYIVAEARRVCAMPERPEMMHGICGMLCYRDGQVEEPDRSADFQEVYDCVHRFIDGTGYIGSFGWKPERETVLAMFAALTAEELFEIITSEKP